MADSPAIEIGVERMVDGMVELFDEIGDLALNRVVSLTRELEGGFNPTLVSPTNVNRFKLAWFAVFGELMAHEMGGPRADEAAAAYWDEMRYQAGERGETEFLDEILAAVRARIEADSAYLEEGVFNAPKSNGGGDRNSGLGVELAALLTDVAFSANQALAPVMPRVEATVEDELINAYGHTTRACGRFTVV